MPPRPRPGAAAGRSNPCPRPGAAKRGATLSHPRPPELGTLGTRPRRAERRYATFKVRRGGGEEIPLVQGKEQQLCFAGAAVKRYPTSKVRETQVGQ